MSASKNLSGSWSWLRSCGKPDEKHGQRPESMGPNFREILPLLVRDRVRFIVVGAGAAIAHGSARATYDVDVVYARDMENIRTLVACLQPYRPYLRGAPPGLPFRWDERTL